MSKGDGITMLSGVVVINKPQDMTSHDVVAIMRKKLKTKKIGHTGTLDPMATGVLPICIGKATKIVDFLMDRKKAYSCEMVLGSATDTQDRWGEITDTSSVEVDEATIVQTVLSFVGEIDQIPPMYSAIKQGGEKLVDLARKGIVVERESRKRQIFTIDNIVVRHRTVAFEVTCSKGTYIRTLCHDIGLKLGTFAHMTALNRTLSEPFHLNDSVLLEELTLENVEGYLVDIERALAFMPEIRLKHSDKLSRLVSNGVKVDFSRFYTCDGPNGHYRLYVGEVFWGIAEKTEKGILMKKVLKEDIED